MTWRSRDGTSSPGAGQSPSTMGACSARLDWVIQPLERKNSRGDLLVSHDGKWAGQPSNTQFAIFLLPWNPFTSPPHEIWPALLLERRDPFPVILCLIELWLHECLHVQEILVAR